MSKFLIVGAGIAGLVYAREIAEAGNDVLVIDKRGHIGGNCFDFVHPCGVRVHKYGPHLFHTSNQEVVEWLSRFTGWIPYEHKVVAELPTKNLVPLPVNRRTLEQVFNLELPDEHTARTFLASLAQPSSDVDAAADAEQYLHAKLGQTLTNLFFRPYSEKMWGIPLSQMDASVVKRLSIRTDYDDRYFPNDSFQALPVDGYTRLFERAFDHPRISLSLKTKFEHSMLASYDHCFNSMPIDEFFNFELGPLPYRSIRFEHITCHRATAPAFAVTNFTDMRPETRATYWHNLPGHDLAPKSDTVLRTLETPCDYRDNNFERYYPVKDATGANAELYHRYSALARSVPNLTFIGRCGMYQYLDMHQVLNQSLTGVRRFLDKAAFRT